MSLHRPNVRLSAMRIDVVAATGGIAVTCQPNALAVQGLTVKGCDMVAATPAPPPGRLARQSLATALQGTLDRMHSAC